MPRALRPVHDVTSLLASLANDVHSFLALSSHSLHQCDDRAERIVCIHVGMWLLAKPVEQLAAVRQLAGEQGAQAKVKALRWHMSTGAAGSGPSMAL